MKNVLLAGTALLGLALYAAPASAELKLDLGGYMRGYAVYADSDEPAGISERDFEFRRDTEIHVSGETTLDNGLTIGFHNEIQVELNDLEDESYAYFSGGWGRVNFGSEDGAAYLLQVAAPSADSNVDGLRTYIQGFNNFTAPVAAFNGFGQDAASSIPGGGQAPVTTGPGSLNALDYDHADFRQTDRLTYLTPKFNGFQAGVSYAPNEGQQLGIFGTSADDTPAVGAVADYEDLWEVAARWDGEFYGFGTSIGAGYSTADIEAADAAAVAGDIADGVDTWNVGASVGFNSFTIGAAYITSETENFDGAGGTADSEKDTWVVGAAWDNGPYHVGASYLEQEFDRGGIAAISDNLEATRATIGGGYTFGPGMTFRGAVAFGEFEENIAGGTANDFTQVTLGTDIQF
jgi:outer membrane protein OmpU